MTYVDDDDFDELEAADPMADDLEEDDAGRCDECGLPVKKGDAIVCPACTAMYHGWCATECIRCKTPLKAAEPAEVAAPRPGRRAAPKRKAAARAPRAR